MIKDKLKEADSNWVDDPNNPNPLSGDTHLIVLMIQENQDVDQLIYEIQMIMNLDNAPEYVEEIFEDKDKNNLQFHIMFCVIYKFAKCEFQNL